MTDKTKRIVATVLTTIPVLVFIIGGVSKLIGAEPQMVVQFLTKAGYGNSFKLLGIAELVIGTLIIIPKTNKIGFLLASCYLGGAFCLELGGGQPPASAVFLAMLWMGMFIKDRGMFLVG